MLPYPVVVKLLCSIADREEGHTPSLSLPRHTPSSSTLFRFPMSASTLIRSPDSPPSPLPSSASLPAPLFLPAGLPGSYDKTFTISPSGNTLSVLAPKEMLGSVVVARGEISPSSSCPSVDTAATATATEHAQLKWSKPCPLPFGDGWSKPQLLMEVCVFYVTFFSGHKYCVFFVTFSAEVGNSSCF